MKYLPAIALSLVVQLVLFTNVYGEKYQPTTDNLAAREWFQDAKFGVFIHFGVYSLLGDGEWAMEIQKIPNVQYERLPGLFNPTRFNADEWVRAFKDAGAGYVTITAKHHDGFSMYDSDVSTYDIVDSTPFGRDIMAELKAACDKHGLKLFFYYSQLDWHHDDYYPRGRTGQVYTGRKEVGDWNTYVDYQNLQLRELLTNYGEVAGIWFDGWWDQEYGPFRDRWRLKETYELIHSIQPQALVGNNHHVAPFPGEDYQMFERVLPGENTIGANTATVSQLPLEMAETMNGSWGFSLRDNAFKSTQEIVRMMVSAAGRNANFLLNTGPMPDGRIQPENLATFKALGVWMRTYGESIYGTRGGPLEPRPWGVTTQDVEAVYIHILNWSDETIHLPLLADRFKFAVVVGTNENVEIVANGAGLELAVPPANDQNWDRIIKLVLK